MEWLNEMRARHTHGYIPTGLCLACRRGWHAISDAGGRAGAEASPPECGGRRYKNTCPDYVDATPTNEEYRQIYERELRSIFEHDTEFGRIAAFGNAKRRREFLIGRAEAAEDDLREIEDQVEGFRTEDGQRLLKKLRWEL